MQPHQASAGKTSPPGLPGIYTLLSKLGFPKSYQGKILFVIFLGTHVPLIALVMHLFFSLSVSSEPVLGGYWRCC